MQKYEDLVYAMGDIFGTEKSAKGDSLALLSNKISTLGGAGSVEQIRKDVTELIEEFHYDHSISLEENERGLTIRILEDILFPSGEARLNESSKDVLVKLAHIIKKLPNDIRVEGHTDNVPISTPVYPSNWHLSVNRALNTAYFLIESVDISADKVSIVGYSEYKPIAQNDTREGRAINRRVDIVIIK
ncbi:MAG: chemotaxis protein MotB [Melioribacteraceae bacterium]|nr:MAG: chemotaxis protein MotB [Melioribacteraceae bacterium]